MECAKTIDLGKSPTGWNELTRLQLLFVCGLFAMGKEQSNFLTRVALNIYGLKPVKSLIEKGVELFLFRKGRSNLILTPEQIADLAKKLGWITLTSDLTLNKIPKFRVGLRKFYGPEDKIFNLTFLEYQSAENYYLAFNKTREVKFLDLLVAILYRPQIKNYRRNRKLPSFTGDRREQFNDYLVEPRAAKLSKLSIAYKYAVYQYFMGCVSHLQKTYPLVFQATAGTSEVNSKVYNHTMLIEYLKGDNINADPLKENVYQIMARCQRDRLRSQSIENLKTKPF